MCERPVNEEPLWAVPSSKYSKIQLQSYSTVFGIKRKKSPLQGAWYIPTPNHPVRG